MAFFLTAITCTKDPVGPGNNTGTVTDIDGNVYHMVKIGNQMWTVENLRVTKYNDGTLIPNITVDSVWNSSEFTQIGAYCYQNNTNNLETIRKFGALYNWYVVEPLNPRKVAIQGWHVPDTTEWNILENYLIANGYNWDGTTTGNKVAKSVAATTDWNLSSQPGAIGNELSKNNKSGFSALPGGFRNSDGQFSAQNIGDYWWSANRYGNFNSLYRLTAYNLDYINRSNCSKCCGFSLRLVRDFK